MHQQYIAVLQLLTGAPDGIDVVGLVVKSILYEGDVKRQGQRLAVAFQHLVKVAGSHNHLFYAGIGKKVQLTAQNGLSGRNFRHAFGMLACEHAHPVAKAGVQY